MVYLTPLFLAAFLTSAIAGPAGQRYTCAQTCSDATKFAYERGTSYEYDYKVQTTTTNSPKDFEDQAVMTINSKAVISVIAHCEYVLTLSDVRLEGSSQSSEFSSELTKQPLRFSFDDGRISEICSEPQEETWTTNFKRGVLSAFQNSMDTLQEDKMVTEIDVTGECKTNYQVSNSEENYFTILRSKSSNFCKRMPGSSHTTLPAALQRLPLLSGDQLCTQEFDNGLLKEAKCKENLILRSVSGNEGGAVTTVETSLSFATQRTGVPSTDFEITKSTLMFDTGFNKEKVEGYFHTIEALLNELDHKSMPVLQPEVPALFSQLVENLRYLDQSQLTILYEANKMSRVWRFLVDAAPMVATSASTALVVNLIATGQMTAEEADVWYTSLAFVPSPDSQMFAAIPELLAQKPSKNALLGVSAMINTYCKKEVSCLEESAVREVLSAIESNLGTACRSSNLSEKEHILVTLKALGNAGHWMNNEVMRQCYFEVENPAEVRVAALEAWRRAPCNADRSGLLDVYLASQEDPEIRIAAYLSLMACPNKVLIDSIKDRLTSESVNQVGSFVWTHLSNLQETASREKQWVQALIGEDMLINKFNISSLKFSRNYESSFYMEESGIGATVDSNVIFSSKSFLPRSGMFNLSFDFFGESINMLEIGGRIEGFEVFAERFFGPEGYYPEETVEGILKGLRQSKSHQETTIEHMLDVVTDEPEGSYYLRILGNDVQYHHFRGIENFFEKKPEFSLIEILMEFAKKGNVDYTKSYKLMDTEFSYPTLSGLPLTLKLNSTATVGLRMDGKFSARSFKDIDIAGHIYPSAAVQVDATMLIDAHVTQSGLKISSNIHSSSFLDGNLKIENGKVIDFALNMPEDKIELIDVKTEKIFIENSIELSSESDEDRRTVKCLDTTRILGVQFCTSLTSSRDKQESSLYLEKTDSHSSYVFRFLKGTGQLSLLFDTPGSSIDRKLSLVTSKNEQTINIDVHTPWKSFKASGARVVGDNGKHFELDVHADNNRIYQVTAGYSVTRREAMITFDPTFIIRTPTSTLADIGGSLQIDSQINSVKAEFHNRGQLPVSVKYSTDYSPELKKIEASISSSVLSASTTGMISHSGRFLSQLDAKYSFMGSPEQSLSHYFKFEKIVNGQEQSYTGALVNQISQLPSVSLNTKGRVSVTPGRIESSASLNYGEDLFDLATDNTINFAFEDETKSYDVRMGVTSSSHDVDALLTEKFMLRRNYLLREAYLRLTPTYEMKSKTEMGYSQTEGFARFKIFLPNFDMVHEMSYTKIAEKYYTAQILGQFNNNNWNIDGHYHDQSVIGESVDLLLGLRSRLNYLVGDADLVIKADQQGVLVNAMSNYNGQKKFAKIEATPTSIELDADIVKHVTLQAQVHPDGPTKTVSLRGTWDKAGDATDITLTGTLTERSVSGIFKFGDIEKSFRAEIEDNGVKVEAHLEANKVISGQISYTIDDNLLIFASLETPFESYEKQDASFTFRKTNNNEFTTQISLTCNNSQLLTLSASGKIESSYYAGNMSTDISLVCDKSIFGFESFALKLEHQRNMMNVDSTLSGKIDGEEIITGFVKKTDDDTRQHIEAKLITPISSDFSFKADFIRLKKHTFEISYGSHHLESSFVVNNLANATGFQANYSLTSSITPNLEIQGSYRKSNNRRNVEVEGIYGEHKCVASFIMDEQEFPDSVKYLVNGRIIIPFMAPITSSLEVTVRNNKQFIIELEMTRFWSSYGSLKVHSNINVEAATNVQLVISVTSPDVRASVDSMFKFEDGSIDTYLNGLYNGGKYGVAVKGNVDVSNREAKLRGSIMTRDIEIFKGVLDHEKIHGTRVTKLTLKIDETIHDIVHQIAYTDKFNWTNKLDINGMHFKNVMAHSNNLYNHGFDWNVNGVFAIGEISTSADIYGKNIDALMNINMSSSMLQNIKSEIKFVTDGLVYKPEITVEYGADKIILKSLCSCLPNECSISFNLTTSFWETISFEGVYKKSSPKALKLSFTKGSNTTNLDVTGVYNTYEKFASIQIDSTHLAHPMRIEAGLLKTDDDSTISFALHSIETYMGKVTFSRLSKTGKINIELNLPCFNFNETSLTLEYDIMKLPAAVKIAFKNNGEIYSFGGVMARQKLTVNINCHSLESKLESSWELNSTNGYILASIISPSNDFESLNLKIEYDTINKVFKLNLDKESTRIISLLGELKPNSGIFNAEVALSRYDQSKVMFSYDESSFRGKMNNMGKTIEFDGIYQLQSGASAIEINLKTPFSDFENSSLLIKYNVAPSPKVYFKTSINEEEVSFTAAANINEVHAPEFSIDVTTFIEQYKTAGATFKYDIRNPLKKCRAELYRNSETITWEMDAMFDGYTQSSVALRAISPIPEYELLELEVHYSFEDNAHSLNVKRKINSVHDEYAVRLSFSTNSFSVSIIPMSSGGNVISIEGSMEHSTTKIYGFVELKIDNDISKITGELLKDSENPNLEVILITPYDMYKSVTINASYKILETEQLLETTIKTQHDTFSVKLQSEQQYKQGEITLQVITPFVEYATIGFKANYNFLQDIKSAKMQFEHNGKLEALSGDLQINDNNIILKIETPFSGYEQMKFTGDFTSKDGLQSLLAKIENGEQTYSLNGDINMSEMYFNIRTSVPRNDQVMLEISGQKTSTGYLLKYKQDDKEHTIVLDYNLNSNGAIIKLQTPFSGYNSLVFEYSFQRRVNALIALINVEKDTFKFEFLTKMKYSDEKGDILISAEIPTINQKFILSSNYDLTGINNIVEITGNYNSMEETFRVTLKRDPTDFAVKITVPFIKREYGAEYQFNFDRVNRSASGSFTAIMHTNTYVFTAGAKLGVDSLEILCKTPFENYEQLIINSNIDFSDKTGKGQLIIGPYETSIEFSYMITNPFIEIVSPFEIIRHFKFSYHISKSDQEKLISISAAYNGYQSEFNVKYAPNDINEIIMIELISNEDTFKVCGGYEFSHQKAYIALSLQTPLRGLIDVRFIGKIDLASDDKAIEITLQNEDDVKMIALNGKFIGDLADIRIRSPLRGLENFRTYGSLNRSKRSLEFSVQNDASSGSLRANFNSLDIQVKSPYAAVRESSLHIKRTDTGGLEIHYKRGDNHIDITASPTGRRRSFDVTVNTAFPGWEFLAISGRLDKDELVAYLSGQINEQKMTITGGGTYSRPESDLKFDITTPYEEYKSVSITLAYNLRRKDFKLDARSSSSDFVVFITNRPSLTVDIFVPNSRQPTIIKGNLTVFNGSFSVSSRFDRWRSFNLEYNVDIGRDSVDITSRIECNGVEAFKLEFTRGGGKAHLMIHARRGENHSILHFERVGFETAEFIYTRNEKQFKVEAQGTGNLPIKGSIDIVVNNSFREIPRTVTAHLEIDRSGSPKHVKLELTFPGTKHYIIDVKYNISLRNSSRGDYDLRVTTPDRRARPYNNVSGSWDFSNHNNSRVEFNIGRAKYEVKGKFGLRESKFVINRTREPDINVEWRLHKTSTSTERIRDYYIKVGTATRFVLYELKGTYSGLAHGESECNIQISRFMAHPLRTKINWHRDDTGLSGSGTFEYGSRNGTFTLNKLKRNASTRSAVISFEATTNIENFSKITVEGEYNFDHQAVVILDIAWDVSKVAINVNIQDISSDFTEQTASFSLPGVGDVDVTFGHDFRNKRKKTFSVIGQLMGRESHFKAEWNRNRDFTKLSGKIDCVTILLGHIVIDAEYDVRNINNANADFKYTRNSDKNVHIKWVRKMTANSLEGELLFESSLPRIPSAKIAVNADFRQGFNLSLLLKGPTKEINLVVNLQENSLTGELTTPFAGFEKVTGSFVYDVTDRKKKTATLRYERGDRTITMDLNLETPSRRAGKLTVILVTPFEFVRTLNLDANWKNRKGEVHYKRNDISYSFTGNAEVKTDRTSFEIKFTPNSGDPINISFSFNAGSLISGGGTEPEEIAELELELLGKRIAFEMNGFRNSDRIMIDIKAESSLEHVRVFEIKLDSEFDAQERNGLLEVTVNDFHFKLKNHFERRPQDGYYWKSEIDSTLSRLPGLTIGFGREGEERILTVGVGDDREVTVFFAPKDRFRRGFSGRLSLPRRGIIEAAYDVNYSFGGRDILNIDFQIQIEPGKVIEADIVYNSDGVQARLSSPRTGRHSARVKRSLTENGFSAEVGFDDYNLSLRGDIMNTDIKRGFILGGEVFGRRISIDTLFQSEGSTYMEGKFIIETSFEGYERLGGMFTLSNIDKQIHARSEINLPSYVTPKVYGSVDLDLNNQVKGLISVDISGESFSAQCNLIGNLKEGYEGQIKIRTPFHAASQFTVSGQLKVESAQIMFFALNIDQLISFKDVSLKLDISPLSTFVEAKAECIYSEKPVHVMYKYNMEKKNVQCELNIFENKASLDITLDFRTVNFDLEISSLFISDPISLTIAKTTQSSTISLTFSKTTHTISGKFDKVDENIIFNILVDSPLFGIGRKMIAFKHTVPQNYLTDDLFVRLTYTAETTHDIIARVDRSNGVKATINMDSPVGNSKIEFVLTYSNEQTDAGILIESPLGNHKGSFVLKSDIIRSNYHQGKLHGEVHLEIEISSSLLANDIVYSVKGEISNGKLVSEQTYSYGGIIQILKTGYSYTPRAVLLILEIETPLFNINKASLNAELRLNKTTRTIIVANFQEQEHTLDIKMNGEEQTLSAVLNTPLIPGGLAKAETSVQGNSMKNIKLALVFKFNRKTFASKLNINAMSTNDMSSELEIKTPFQGYRKMNFGASFINNDMIRAIFFADKPIGYRFEMTAGNSAQGYDTAISILTPIRGFETITALVQLPMDKTAPKILVKLPTQEYGLDFEVQNQDFTRKIDGNLNLNGLTYGAGFELRNKAPYEVSYHYQVQKLYNRFHIMMDSSVLSMLTLFL